MLVLRTNNLDNTSYGGFTWPVSGPVSAPDWDPAPKCGGGLHGFAWGEGNGALAQWDPDAVWQVLDVPDGTAVDLGGKVKFPAATVVHSGTRETATAYLAERAPGRAIIGATATTGDGATATVGDGGTATAGHDGTATAGDDGTATAGHDGTATAGHRGTATAGHRGTATAGDHGTATTGHRGTATTGHGGTATTGHGGTATAGDHATATAGDHATATAGDHGTATAGDYGTATAGHRGIIRIRWHDGSRYRDAVGYVGEGGIEPNRPYRVDANGRFIDA